MANLSEPVWMTPAALTALRAELAGLDETADDGAAQGRAAQLREIIRNAEVGQKADDGVVEPGMRITVRFADGDTDTFLLGSRDVAVAGDDIDVYSPASPLGVAINGRRVGDEASYQTPAGTTVRVTVVEATPFG